MSLSTRALEPQIAAPMAGPSGPVAAPAAVRSRRVLAMGWLAGYAVLLVFERDPLRAAVPLLVAVLAEAAAALVTRWRGRTSPPLVVGAVALTVFAAVLVLRAPLGLRPTAATPTALSTAAATAAMSLTASPAYRAFGMASLAGVVPALMRRRDDGRTRSQLPELVASLAIALVSYRLRWLTADGAVAAMLVGLVCFAAAGWRLVALLLVFFATSSILTRGRKDRRVQADAEHGRNATQVIALGLLPAVTAAAGELSGDPRLIGCAAAAVAAAAADTWAVEIGRRSRRTPVLITTWERVQAGRSGGVTALGFAASAAGASIIALAGLALGLLTVRTMLPVALFGFTASIIDSLLGALWQAEYRCGVCGRRSETPVACHAQPAPLVKGWSWLTNEAVNFVMSFSAAALFLAWTGGAA